MSSWFFEILFFGFIFSPILVWIAAWMLGMALIDKALAPPKAPPHVETPEEAAASEAWVREMLAQAEKSRLAAHHH